MKIAALGPLGTTAPPPGQDRDRDRMLTYLRAGRLLRAARSLAPDELDPGRTEAVPITLLTDGSWVWSGAVIYYAEQYGVPIDAGLVEHARRRDFTVAEVSTAAVAAALAALDASPIGGL